MGIHHNKDSILFVGTVIIIHMFSNSTNLSLHRVQIEGVYCSTWSRCENWLDFLLSFPGRPFLRHLYAIQDIGLHPDHHNCLNGAARADILWWHVFASQWNGISMLWDLDRLTPDIKVVSDASGSWGCGAYWDAHWFHFPWPLCLQSLPIATTELIPVVVAAAIFGHQWRGQLVKFTVDNMAIVHHNSSLQFHLQFMVYYSLQFTVSSTVYRFIYTVTVPSTVSTTFLSEYS